MQRRSTDPDPGRRNVHHQQERPSPGAAAPNASASKNTNRVHDTSSLVNRLKHLEDCIEQVKSLIKNLEKSDDPNAQQHMLKLRQMLHQLSAEQAGGDMTYAWFTALSQQQSPQQHHPAETLQEGDGASGFTANSQDGASLDARQLKFMQDDEANLMRQNEIMRKILESKEKLMELQQQHSVVATMQKKAENKLAEARAFQDQLDSSTPDMKEWVTQLHQASMAGTLLPPPLQASNSRKSGGHKVHHQQQGGATCAGDGPLSDGDWKLDVHKSEVEELRMRLRQLQETKAAQGMLEQLVANTRGGGASADDLADFGRERRKLEGKLKDLQEQKAQVDGLLAELSMLQAAATAPPPGISRTAGADLAPPEDVQVEDSSIPGPSAKKNTLKHGSDEKRHLQEMKKTLQQLKCAVQNLDQSNSFDSAFSSTDVSTVSHPSSQQLPLKSKRSKSPSPALQMVPRKKDNLRVDFPVRRHYEAEGRANEDADLLAQAAAATPTAVVQPPTTVPPPIVQPSVASPSIVPPPTVDGAESQEENDALAEKVRQLQATRNRLQYLQGLMASLQEETGPMAPVPPHGSSEERTSDVDPMLSDILNKQRELLQLQEQQRRHLMLRQQMAVPNLPATTKNQLRAGAGEQSSQEVALAPQRNENAMRSKKDNLNTLTVPKNLYESSKSSNRSQDHSNLEFSGSRERAMLEELLKQEHSKQLLSYSHNEDVRSTSSCSGGSEPFDGSVMAGADTTIAATWGGSSTQENLEDDEEEAPESGDAAQESEGSPSEVEAEPPVAELKPHVTRERVPGVPETSTSFGRADSARIARSLSKGSGSGQAPPNTSASATWPTRQGAAGCRQSSAPPQSGTLAENDGSCSAERQGPPSASVAASGPLPWQQFPAQLQQQFEQTNTLCHSILQDQQALTSALLASSSVGLPGGSTQRPPGFDTIQQYSIQQQQQLLLSIIHCYHILSLQQLEINQLQQSLQQLSVRSVEDAQLRASPGGFYQSPDPVNPLLLSTWSPNHVSFGGVNIAQGPAISPRPPPQADQRCVQGTLNNQVVPGTRANNFWDNFRSYSRQNLLSGSAPPVVPGKSNEGLANFQQFPPSCGLPEATTSPADPRQKVCSFHSFAGEEGAAADGSRHPMRPVPNAHFQDARAATKRPNVGRQDTAPAGGHVTTSGDPSGQRRRQPSHSACEALKCSIQAELSRLLTNNEDAGSLASLLHQLQSMDVAALQMSSTPAHGSGGARRKVGSLSKSNVPKESPVLPGCRILDSTQRGASESSPDLRLNSELYDPRVRAQGMLADSLLDRNPSKLSDGVSARKKFKGRFPTDCPASWPAASRAPAERNDHTESLVPEHDRVTSAEEDTAEVGRCMLRLATFLRNNSQEEWNTETLGRLVNTLGSIRDHQQAVVGALRSCLALEHRTVSEMEYTILTRVREAFVREGCLPLAAWGDSRPEKEGEAGVGQVSEPGVPVKLENEATAAAVPLLRAKRDNQGAEDDDVLPEVPDVPRLVLAGHIDPVPQNEPVSNNVQYAESGHEQEDEEDRETGPETEPEDTQDLAEADQSPAASQDVVDRNPEGDMVAAEIQGAVGGAVGAADAGGDDPSPDDVPTKLMASEEVGRPSEEPVVNGAVADDASLLHEGSPNPLLPASSGREG